MRCNIFNGYWKNEPTFRAFPKNLSNLLCGSAVFTNGPSIQVKSEPTFLSPSLSLSRSSILPTKPNKTLHWRLLSYTLVILWPTLLDARGVATLWMQVGGVVLQLDVVPPSSVDLESVSIRRLCGDWRSSSHLFGEKETVHLQMHVVGLVYFLLYFICYLFI